MATTAPPIPKTKVFPKADILKVLMAELTDVAENEAGLHGIKLPTDPAGIAKAPVPLDSLTVVDTLCSIEPVLGFPPRESIVRTGGYDSIEEALDHMLPRIERVWNKKWYKGAKK